MWTNASWLPPATFELAPGVSHELAVHANDASLLLFAARWTGAGEAVVIEVRQNGATLATLAGVPRRAANAVAHGHVSVSAADVQVAFRNAGSTKLQVKADVGLLPLPPPNLEVP